MLQPFSARHRSRSSRRRLLPRPGAPSANGKTTDWSYSWHMQIPDLKDTTARQPWQLGVVQVGQTSLAGCVSLASVKMASNSATWGRAWSATCVTLRKVSPSKAQRKANTSRPLPANERSTWWQSKSCRKDVLWNENTRPSSRSCQQVLLRKSFAD